MVFDTAIRARDRRVASQRTFAGEFEELDHDIIKKITHSLGDKEKRVYMHIASGGFWGEDHKKEAFDAEGKCPHCGLSNIGTQHILWQCPVINQFRTNGGLNHIRVQDLPKCVANGLPKSLGPNFTKDFWGRESDIASSCDGNEPENPNSKFWRRQVNQSMQGLLEDQVRQKEEVIKENDSVSTLFCRLRHADNEIIHPVPYPCLLPAPEEINVFIDGSLKNPQKWFLVVGGAGTFWLNRVIDRDNLKLSDTLY